MKQIYIFLILSSLSMQMAFAECGCMTNQAQPETQVQIDNDKEEKQKAKIEIIKNIKIDDISEANLRELDVRSQTERAEYLDKVVSDIKMRWVDYLNSFYKIGTFTTGVTFTVNNLGRLDDLKIVKSSSNSDYDELILTFFKTLPLYEKFSNNTNESFYNVPIELILEQTRNDFKIAKVQKFKYLDDEFHRYQKYMDEINDYIDANWHPDNSYSNQKCLNAIVHFIINRKGNPFEVQLKLSSNNKKFDKSVINFINKSSFPEIPSEIEDVQLDIRYNFKLNCNRKFSLIDSYTNSRN